MTTELAWAKNAACIGKQELFFSDHSGKIVRRAKKICETCAVRQECLEYALTHNEFGVWGGMTMNERRRSLRAQRKLAKSA